MIETTTTTDISMGIESIRTTQKKYASRAMAAAIILALASLIIGRAAMGRGLVLGTIFSIINFVLIGIFLPKRVRVTGKRAMINSAGSILLRYMLLAIPMIIAVKFDRFHPVTVIIGIFMIQLMIGLETLKKVMEFRLNPHGGSKRPATTKNASPTATKTNVVPRDFYIRKSNGKTRLTHE